MNTYLEIADLFTCLQQEEVTDWNSLEELIEAIADKFSSLDPDFDKVIFMNDCQLAEGEH